MARTEIISDDITGEQGAEQVDFAWDGVNFAIDLTEASKKKLEDLLRPYLDVARPRMALTDGERGITRRTRSTAPKDDSTKIDYASMEHAGKAHRGRISPEEAALIRDNFDTINKRLSDEGLPMLDPSDEKTIKRYGLDQPNAKGKVVAAV